MHCLWWFYSLSMVLSTEEDITDEVHGTVQYQLYGKLNQYKVHGNIS